MQIHYDVRGDGISVLLMHAFPLDNRMFPPQPGARLITFDTPGAGKSPLPAGPLGMETIADTAAELLDHLEVEQAVVAGVSMGGYAALSFLRHPQRLLGLILSNTRVIADSEEARRGRFEMAALARREGAAPIAERMLPRLLGETTRRTNPALVECVRQIIESQHPEGIARLLEALAERQDSTALLETITVPTLVIAGEEDVISAPAEMAGWAGEIRGARFEVIPVAGHLPSLEQAEEFQRVVQEFLIQYRTVFVR